MEVGESGCEAHLRATWPWCNDGGCEARDKAAASRNLLVDGRGISVA